jgi:transcriptional regulator
MRQDIPLGTLDMLILKVLLRREPLHGFEIADHIQSMSDDVLQVEEGSLYPALQRMLAKAWVTAEWGKTAENRRARYYKTTVEGRKHLTQELNRYDAVSSAIGRVLQRA